ncbi:MAG: hypothetical protein DRN57_03995 [Thermoplasmata archaeon]|nr:MAG: hypothetical protein DRN57_03995 [Thermoplasmata archaeon]
MFSHRLRPSGERVKNNIGGRWVKMRINHEPVFVSLYMNGEPFIRPYQCSEGFASIWIRFQLQLFKYIYPADTS